MKKVIFTLVAIIGLASNVVAQAYDYSYSEYDYSDDSYYSYNLTDYGWETYTYDWGTSYNDEPFFDEYSYTSSWEITGCEIVEPAKAEFDDVSGQDFLFLEDITDTDRIVDLITRTNFTEGSLNMNFTTSVDNEDHYLHAEISVVDGVILFTQMSLDQVVLVGSGDEPVTRLPYVLRGIELNIDAWIDLYDPSTNTAAYGNFAAKELYQDDALVFKIQFGRIRTYVEFNENDYDSSDPRIVIKGNGYAYPYDFWNDRFAIYLAPDQIGGVSYDIIDGETGEVLTSGVATAGQANVAPKGTAVEFDYGFGIYNVRILSNLVTNLRNVELSGSTEIGGEIRSYASFRIENGYQLRGEIELYDVDFLGAYSLVHPVTGEVFAEGVIEGNTDIEVVGFHRDMILKIYSVGYTSPDISLYFDFESEKG